MRRIFRGLAATLLVAIVVLGGMIAFDAPAKPTPLAAVSDAFDNVDFSGVPPVQSYIARDGATLGYRAYEGSGDQVVVLIHGSTDDGGGIHPLARGLRDAGATVYVPVLRGHGTHGGSGDIGYIGQLDDDLADLVALLRKDHPNASYSLIGFSSGGGFTIRMMVGPQANLFDRYIMVSPVLPHGAPTLRPRVGGWVSIALPRIIALTIVNSIGIDWFNGLPIIAFATSPKATNLTGAYSFRLAINFGAPDDYLSGLGKSTKPAAVLVGSKDELFYPERFAPLLNPARADLPVTIVPGVGHIGMTVTPDGIAAVRRAFLDLTAPAT
jgi:alpha-beta hydrolase superfamily lysophospholipase